MIEAISRAHAFAPAATPVIPHGESGTGKTFFAEYIHRLSGRVGSLIGIAISTLYDRLRDAGISLRAMRRSGSPKFHRNSSVIPENQIQSKP